MRRVSPSLEQEANVLIDVAMLNAAIALFTAFVAACLLMMSRQQWQQTGVRFWILASALIAFGHALNSANRWHFPSWITSDLAIHLILLGGVCHWWSVQTFFKREPERMQVLACVALYFLAWLCLRSVDYQLAAALLMWGAIALINFGVLLSLIIVSQQVPRRTLIVLGLGFFLVGMVYVESVFEDAFFPTQIVVGNAPPPTYIICAVLLIMAQIAKGMGFLMLVNDKLEQSLRLSAELDALTGLYNRRGFFRHAQLLLAHAMRMKKAVLMLDIDFFKRINDEYGHLVGDTVLQEVAKRIRHVLREGDLVARYGGEEFIVLCFEAETTVALNVAERMRTAIGESPISVNNQRIKLTISIGVSCWTSPDLALETQIELADNALYMAKERGRDRVCLAGGE